MLAYVFWHWPKPGIDDASYRNLLQSFHHTLTAHAPGGFLRSIAFAVSQLPLQTNSEPGFEDWYLLADSAALDVINHAAVSGVCEDPHNHVASHAAGGTAGLYRLRSGSESLTGAKYATWLSKPDGLSYSDFYSKLESITSNPSVGLWQRQMTLGPTTEFAIYSEEPINFDEAKAGRSTRCELIWPSEQL